jgi:hypothetical protein
MTTSLCGIGIPPVPAMGIAAELGGLWRHSAGWGGGR